jgi:hypothetical protein
VGEEYLSEDARKKESLPSRRKMRGKRLTEAGLEKNAARPRRLIYLKAAAIFPS